VALEPTVQKLVILVQKSSRKNTKTCNHQPHMPNPRKTNKIIKCMHRDVWRVQDQYHSLYEADLESLRLLLEKGVQASFSLNTIKLRHVKGLLGDEWWLIVKSKM